MNAKPGKNDIIFAAASFASFLASFLLIRLSGFSSYSMVNIESYFIRSMVVQTAGFNTLDALAAVLQPFQLLAAGLIFYALGFSVLSAYGYYSDGEYGRYVGVLSAVAALGLFPSVWGAFLAASVLVSCLFASSLAGAYKRELKRWIVFRVGSHTMGKMFLVLTIFMSVGVFAAIMSEQASYSSVFKTELVDATKSILLSVPGASAIPEDIVNSQVEQLVEGSPIFESYITWMPLTTALTVWFALQFAALFGALFGGVFTYVIVTALGGKL